MDDSDIRQRLDLIEKKVDAIYISAEKTRKYFLTMMVGTLVAFILPLVGLLFAIPSFISLYSSLGALQ